MKNHLFTKIFIASLALSLSSCDLSPNDEKSGLYVPDIDNSVDLKEYEDDEYVTTDDTYYESEYISFIMEVRGYYQTDIPFTLDKDNDNLRIYDNMYFYKGDFFQLMSADYKYIWATLKNEKTEYLTPLREQGEDIQVDVKKSGIYKIVLDITTMIMDFEYKSEIVTPYYYPFKNCVIGTLDENKHIVYNELLPNPNNPNEFVINNYEVATGKLYSFYSKSNTSVYKLTVAEDSTRYATVSPLYDDVILFNISGKVNITVNNKTYEVKAEVADPASLTYDCLTYNGEQWITLEPKDEAVPYIFEYAYEATSDVGGYGVMSDDLPKFYNKSYKEYKFSVTESNLLGNNKGTYYFKKRGHYLILIDVYNLTLSVSGNPIA